MASANWHPFIPPADGHGNFGWGGIPTAAASIFFAYIGFDAVSTAAQEAKNPQRDMPIGILGSLVVCTILYILVSLVLTGLVSYKTLNVSAPVALAIDATGVGWGSMLVKIGAVFGLATVMLVMLLGQTRVFYSMSKDGLLPKWASAIHPKFRTPWITTIVFGSFAAIMPAFLPIDETLRTGEYRHAAGLHDCERRRVGTARAASRNAAAIQDAAGAAGADSWALSPRVYLMSRLPRITWTVMIVWLLIGLVIYFGYSVKHSKVQRLPVGAWKGTEGFSEPDEQNGLPAGGRFALREAMSLKPWFWRRTRRRRGRVRRRSAGPWLAR